MPEARRWFSSPLSVILLLVGFAAGFWLVTRLDPGRAPSWLRLDGRLMVVESQPQPGGEVGANGPLRLRFSSALSQSTVDGRVTLGGGDALDTVVDGEWLILTPNVPLSVGEHTLILAAGIEADEGKSLDASWELPFTVRAPDVLFLRQGGSGRQLLRWNGGDAVILSGTESVLDFSADPSGERVVFAGENGAGGSDLWLVDRDGGGLALVVNCGPDQCRQPSWAQDGKRLAFSRTHDGQPRIWTLDAASLASAPLFQDDSILGSDPQWSHNGLWLAAIDTRSARIWLLDLDTSAVQSIPTEGTSSGRWSPLEAELAFVDFRFEDERPTSDLVLVDPSELLLERLLGPENGWVELGVPAWTPDGRQLALSGRRGVARASSMWLVEVAGLAPSALTDDESYAYGGPEWDPSGDQLLLQRFPFGTPAAAPDLLLWERSSGRLQVLMENASLGRWLP